MKSGSVCYAGYPNGRNIRRENVRRERYQNVRSRKKKRSLHYLFGGVFLLAFDALLLLYLYGQVTRLETMVGRLELQLELQNGVTAEDEKFLIPAGDYDNSTAALSDSYVERVGLDRVDRPIERSTYEVLERLETLSAESDMIKTVYQNWEAYPEKLLEALANNPEMADFAAGYLKEDRSVSGGLTDWERQQEYPLFLQWDPRWGYVEYGDGSNIGLAGCGPTCLSMVLYYLTDNEKLTPDVIGRYGMENGYYMSGTGTAWALMEDVPELYGLEVRQVKVRRYNMEEALDNGDILICSMGKGDFTAAGHFVVIYGYDREGFLINDPNCVARSRQHWSYEQLEKQIKNIWVYSK